MEHLEALANPELESKYQTANNTFNTLAELFQPLEFEYHSYSLYSHEADASALRLLDQDIRTTVIHTATVLSLAEATVAQKAFRGSIERSANTWQMWQTLVSLLAELSVSRICVFNMFFCSFGDADTVYSCSSFFRLPRVWRCLMTRGAGVQRRMWTGPWSTMRSQRMPHKVFCMIGAEFVT